MLSMLGCHLEAQLHQSLSTRLLCSVDVPQGIDHLNLSGSFDAGGGDIAAFSSLHSEPADNIRVG